MEQLNTFFQDKNIQSVLDVGTGAGQFIPVLKIALPNAKITGIDPDIEALKQAKENYPDEEFVELNEEALKFDNDTFDVAAISMALHHLPDVKKTLSEMKRVVKPGGWIVVNELYSNNLNAAQKVHKLMHHFRSKIDRLNGISHNDTFTRNEIVNLVKSAGLNVQLHFDQNKDRKEPGVDEINERMEKLRQMLNGIKGGPEYNELSNEIPKIREALLQHGFQMATRVVIVASVE